MSRQPVSGPHLMTTRNVDAIMREVIYALVPALGFGVFLFGWPALWLTLVTLVSALSFEALGLKLQGKKVRPQLADGSALLTGLLLAMTLPPWAPWWIAMAGAAIAIILGKQVYGGLGQNPFNPAMLARVALLISFPVAMTSWAEVGPLASGPDLVESLKITFLGLAPADALTGATTLGAVKTGFSLNQHLPQALQDYSPWLAFVGWERGSLGETSSLLILAGGLWLMGKGIVRWPIPVSLLSMVALLAAIFHVIDPERYLDPWVHLNSGALMLVAFFIATDYVTSPNTPLGQIVFGLGLGLLIYMIRTFGGYPEGAGFAVLLMNAMTPVIDHYLKPRIYGRYRNGKPLDIKSSRS